MSWIDANPERVLGLLEALKDDPASVVRRSVANHLNDLSKTHPRLALDTADRSATRPFWKAVLGLSDSVSNDNDVVDEAGSLPTLWFQEAQRDPQVPAQRFHLDLRVPPEVAERRVRDAVAAGGTLVSDERAPTFWVLADAQGNRACVTTWQGRTH